MIYRILYIAWKIFWSSTLVLAATIMLFAGMIFLLLQTNPVKGYLADRVETWFNDNYKGTVTVGEIGGILPIHAELHDVALQYDEEKVASFERLKISVDLIALLRNHLTINDIDLSQPDVILQKDETGNYTLVRAIERHADEDPDVADPETTRIRTFRTIDIYAPLLRVSEGSVTVRDWPDEQTVGYRSEPFRVQDISMEMFLEISEDQRYLDISRISMFLDDLGQKELTLSGQIYNDSHFLEFNAINIGLGESFVRWESDLSGIDLLAGNIAGQFKKAPVSGRIHNSFFSADEIGLFYQDLPENVTGARFGAGFEGDSDMIRFDDAFADIGTSHLRFSGTLDNARQPELLAYNIELEEMTVGDQELYLIYPQARDWPVSDLSAIAAGGTVAGNRDTLETDMRLRLPEGEVALAGGMLLKHPYPLELTASGKEINLASIEGLESHPSMLNAEILLASGNTWDEKPEFLVNLDIFDSRYDHFSIPDFHLDITYSDQIAAHEFAYYQEDAFISGEGQADFTGDRPHVMLQGRSEGLNLSDITDQVNLPESSWNMSYDFNWHGLNPDNAFGRMVLDIMPSSVNGSDLRAHQLYFDLNHPESDKRSLRLTSSVLDLLLEGDLTFSSVGNIVNHWHDYFATNIRREFLFEEFEEPDTTEADKIFPDEHLEASVFLEFKDLELLQSYIPKFPLISSRGSLNMDVNAGSDSLDLQAQWHDDQTKWKELSLTRSDIILNGSFSHNLPLREQLVLDVDFRLDQLVYQDQKMDTLYWDLDFRDNKFTSRTRIESFFDEVRFSSYVSGSITDDLVHLGIDEFIIGNDRYLWQAENNPVITLDNKGTLKVDQFSLASGSDRVFIDGVFSSSEKDSVIYQFDGVNLDRISRMIDGRIDFQGELNGDIVTKDLLHNPTFQGRLNADRLAFGGRIIGDAELTSTFNPSEDRFDTRLTVLTDEEKYSDYIEQNNGVRQNLSAEGWFRAPDDNRSADSLYYFDVNAEEIDAWFLIYFMDSIFESVEGSGKGTGYITGNFDHADFSADFEIAEAVLQPVFFETEYVTRGPVSMTRSEGITFHDLDVRDRAGGTGVLSGKYDFNDFEPEKFMDITLEMDNLIFLNNSDAPEVPFFGSVAGTGKVNISGSNVSPYVRTVDPIHTTSPSRLAIPLVDQGLDEDQGRFIRFVNDFSEYDLSRRLSDDPAVLRQIDRSFMEVFRLDLQFVANDNSTLQLIFDPVTGEIVNAEGSGRVRINLEDESLEIFGNFNIDDGNYLFVGGDILTRRFTLRQGGTIRWDGDPSNALLDITAAYRSRANIAPLMGGGPEERNRIPVELLLEITGPIENIENDFFFDFPNAIDATQNAAVLNVLNSEEQKLLQATSLLFTGGFISGALVGDTQTQELGTTLQARAGQVGLSQLLSTQINTLLSDNLLNLDVDLNLLGFDQADLGIALRLFDDRLILRREGEVGGDETNIGDLGATYRINPNLSVEVFHRKDPMLMSILGTQADVENVNGVGLEAQYNFNSWRDFGKRIWRNVTTVFGLFGSSDDEEEREELEPGVAATEP